MSNDAAHPATLPDDAAPEKRDFIRQIVREDLASGRHTSVKTRFPPEPNGYLHIGHAKAICLDFGIAAEFGGVCNLRLDDTNPAKEDPEYVRAIQDDVRWLGFDWHDLRHASDYFEVLYLAAEKLIRQGDAFVCDLSADEVRAYRGTLTEPGRDSPYRDRSVEENLDLFRRMRAGEFPDGARTLRAKIDMASGNINLRDPALYRIKHVEHQNTGNDWPIYPMYDYAHSLSDAVEGITHSLCTLEFESHRPLYDWVLDNIPAPTATRPRQYEFSRLELLYSITSKRKLNQLVSERHVQGWDDPRMPTISGMRRRGYTPEGLRLFAKRVGISKSENVVDMSVLEGAVREELEESAPRMMAVLNPIKIELVNYEDGLTQSRSAPYHPHHPEMGEREVPISKNLYIEADDFSENPPSGWQRLTVGGEVRLRYSYVIKCEEVVKDASGRVVKLKCSIDHDTLGKKPEGRKVKGVIHWLSAEHAVAATVRLYDRLFTVDRPDAVRGEDGQYLPFTDFLNPESVTEISAYVEPVANTLPSESRWQFERLGYFVTDRKDHTAEQPLFNRTVGLKDTWQAKE